MKFASFNEIVQHINKTDSIVRKAFDANNAYYFYNNQWFVMYCKDFRVLFHHRNEMELISFRKFEDAEHYMKEHTNLRLLESL